MVILLYVLATLLAFFIGFVAQSESKSSIGKIARVAFWCAPMVGLLVTGIVTDTTREALLLAFGYFMFWFFCYVVPNDK